MCQIHSAIRAKTDLEDLNRLIDLGLNVNERDARGQTPLHVAAACGYTDGLVVLLNKGALVSSVDGNGRCALACAVLEDHTEAALLLLARGSDPDAAVGNRTLLTCCLLNGNMLVARAALARGASVAKLDSHGESPLHAAVSCGDIAAVQMLLDAGARPAQPSTGGTPTYLAEVCGVTEIRDLLLRASDCDDQVQLLQEAASKRNAKTVAAMLHLGFSIDVHDRHGRTALQIACERSDVTAVECLIRLGADPNTILKSGLTRNDVSCRFSDEKVSKLIEAAIAIRRIGDEI